MLIPFDRPKKNPSRNAAPAASTALDCSVDWQDGSYLVGILDGTLMGVTPLSNGLCLVDPTDAAEVLTMLREYLPAEVRAQVQAELMAEDLRPVGALRVVK